MTKVVARVAHLPLVFALMLPVAFGLVACSADEDSNATDTTTATPVGVPDAVAADDTGAGNGGDAGQLVDTTDGTGSLDTAFTDAGFSDSWFSDSGPSDSGSSDSGSSGIGQDTSTSLPPVSCGFTMQWTAPAKGSFAAVGDDLVLSGSVVTAKWLSDKLKVQWSVDGTPLATTQVASNGTVSHTTKALPQGAVLLQAQVLTPNGPCVESADLSIGMCAHKIAESFDAKTTGKVWKTFGDAYWDKGGWLEMTGNAQSKQGAFYDVVHNVSPGDASVRFRIATGGGINSGADGYALNFVEAPSVMELEKIIKAAGKGGCLGYGVAGKCGKLSVQAFHVEFDTWQNKADPNTDPTASNHIGVLLNGDAGDHKLWAALDNLEDLKWHDVRVDVIGTSVKVYWDGIQKVEKVITGLDFRGGRIFISGSTGWATNFHRLDDLVVLHGCK